MARVIVEGLPLAIIDQATLFLFANAGRSATDSLGPGQIVECQVIGSDGHTNQAIIGYSDAASADQAVLQFDGSWIYGNQISVRRLDQTASSEGQDYFVFVGDLSPEVDDAILARAFQAFSSVADVRVIFDRNGSKGFGFVTFRDWTEAQASIATMNGEWLAGRPIRVNWANARPGQAVASSGPRRQQRGAATSMSRSGSSSSEAPSYSSHSSSLSFDDVSSGAQPTNTTVYVGNLLSTTTPSDLAHLFAPYGQMLECRMQTDRGFSFVRLATHEAAAAAIVGLQSVVLNGRPLKTQWGRDRSSSSSTPPSSSFSRPSSINRPPQPLMPIVPHAHGYPTPLPGAVYHQPTHYQPQPPFMPSSPTAQFHFMGY